MPPERRPPDDPIEWLNRAKSNLARATADIDLPSVYLEDLCFDAQQAAEKAIKALLLFRGVLFPFVHDLAELITVLQQSGQEVPPSIAEAARLTRFGVETRYPSLTEAVTREDYDRCHYSDGSHSLGRGTHIGQRVKSYTSPPRSSITTAMKCQGRRRGPSTESPRT